MVINYDMAMQYYSLQFLKKILKLGHQGKTYMKTQPAKTLHSHSDYESNYDRRGTANNAQIQYSPSLNQANVTND